MATASKNPFAGNKSKTVADPDGVDALVVITSSTGDKLEDYNLTLLEVSGAGGVNLQFVRNFDNKYFVTVFGDQLRELTFKGVVLANSCDQGGGGKGLAAFYHSNAPKIDGDSLPIITISHSKGDFVFSGVLVGATFGPYDKSGISGYSFKLTVKGLLR